MLILKRGKLVNPNIKPQSTGKINCENSHSYKTPPTRLGSALVERATLRNRLRDMFSPITSPNIQTTLFFSKAKLYSASLSDKGTITSAGGEGFTSPRSWLKAILGSRRKVKNELVWKMVIRVTINPVDTWFSFLEHASRTIAFHF